MRADLGVATMAMAAGAVAAPAHDNNLITFAMPAGHVVPTLCPAAASRRHRPASPVTPGRGPAGVAVLAAVARVRVPTFLP
jgi:DNA-binding beta-propeller fold protein YncE